MKCSPSFYSIFILRSEYSPTGSVTAISDASKVPDRCIKIVSLLVCSRKAQLYMC